MRAGATAVRGHVWPVDVAQARAPPHLATGGQRRWARRQGHHLTWPRVVMRGGAGKGNGGAWPRVASGCGAGKGTTLFLAWPRVVKLVATRGQFLTTS